MSTPTVSLTLAIRATDLLSTSQASVFVDSFSDSSQETRNRIIQHMGPKDAVLTKRLKELINTCNSASRRDIEATTREKGAIAISTMLGRVYGVGTVSWKLDKLVFVDTEADLECYALDSASDAPNSKVLEEVDL